nr:hypothetical protein CFP56_09993 [Quercus suber]
MSRGQASGRMMTPAVDKTCQADTFIFHVGPHLQAFILVDPSLYHSIIVLSNNYSTGSISSAFSSRCSQLDQPAKLSAREKELQSAEIRSHAAKISHRYKELKDFGQTRSTNGEQKGQDDEKERKRLPVHHQYMHYRMQQLSHARQVSSWQDQLWPMSYLNHQKEYLTQPDLKPSIAVLSHVTEGLRIIRERLSKGIMDNATLVAILFVPFCEVERRPFAIPDSAYDISALPPELQLLVEQDIIGGPAINLALNLIDMLGSNTIQPSTDELGYSFQHTWRLFDVRRMTEDHEPSTEMIITQALQVYCIHVMGPRGIAGIIPRSGRWHMTSAMEQCRKRRKGEEERALFWAWIVTLVCWRLPNGELSSWGLKLRDMHLIRFSWVASSAQAADILNDYVSDAQLLDCHRKLVQPIKTMTNIAHLLPTDQPGPQRCREFSYS